MKFKKEERVAVAESATGFIEYAGVVQSYNEIGEFYNVLCDTCRVVHVALEREMELEHEPARD